MTSFARGLLVLLVMAVLVVTTVDFLDPATDDRGEHSVTVVLVIVGTIALVQLLGSVLRRHAGIWRRRTPLWSRSGGRTVPKPALAALGELEAMIIAASTGGPRARERLDRRLAALGCETLAQHLDTTDPSPQQVTDAVARVLDQARPPAVPISADPAPFDPEPAPDSLRGSHVH